MRTTLFIPVRNESVGIREILPKINPAWVDEILFVDGNSTDGTREYLQSKGYKVLLQKSMGIAGAYWECAEAATGDVIIAFSPDGNSLPELIPDLVNKMKEGYDMVIASRYLPPAKSEDDDLVTAFGNWMFTKMINVFFGGSYTDSLVMFRAFKKDLITRLPLDPYHLPVFEYQMAIRCAKRKMKVLEIPGSEPKRVGNERKMKPIYNGLSLFLVFFAEIFGFKKTSFFLDVKKVSMQK